VPRHRDDNSGKYKEVYSDEDILSVLRGTRLATSEVADKIGCHRTTAHDKLNEMETNGKVQSTQAGNTYIWEIS
jgi:DNA-binding IclR family transcriptional regulator